MNTPTINIQDAEIEMYSKIQEVERLKSFLLANISHEFRTPMNAIMGFSDLLLDDQTTENEKNMFIHEIRSGCGIMMELVDSFIEAAKLFDNKEKLYLEPCLLNDIFEQACSDFRKTMQISYKTLDFRVKQDVGMHIGKVLVDHDKLFRVLEILLHNAYKFTSAGYIEAGFHLLNEKEFEFYVEDSGIGISEEKRNEVFDLFIQAEKGLNRPFNGLGLGLSVAQKLVALMNGQIQIQTAHAKGTRISFSIPYRNAVEPYNSFEYKKALSRFTSRKASNHGVNARGKNSRNGIINHKSRIA